MAESPLEWTDMSNYLVHFTRGDEADGDYEAMMSICYQQVLLSAPFGIGRRRAPDGASQAAVCFSEIPPGQWQRLAERRRSEYGIAFSKRFLLSRGAGAVWYARRGTPTHQAVLELMEASKNDANSPVWKLTRMIDEPGERYEFEWEREWRVIGDLAFETEDVSFLIIPERNHEAALGFFEDAEYNDVGPNYSCPFVDATWSRERVLQTLNASGVQKGS
jgi:hypothetical protein